MACPVMKVPAFEANRIAAPAISSGSPMRPSGVREVARLRLSGFSQSALGKVGANETGGDAIDAHVVRSELDGEIARELKVRRLGNAIGAEDRAAAQAADRGHDDDRAVLAGDHLRRHQVDQPVVGDDVVAQRLGELFVGDGVERSVMRIGRGVADQDVDLAEDAHCFLDQVLELFLRRDVGGDGDGAPLAVFGVDRVGDFAGTARPCARRRRPWLRARPSARRWRGRCPRDDPVTTATLPSRSNSDTKAPPHRHLSMLCAAYIQHRRKAKGARRWPPSIP